MSRSIVMPTQTINIRELNPDMIKPTTKEFNEMEKPHSSKIICIGKPGTGKTTIISSLLYSKKHIIPVGEVFSGSEDSNKYYEELFPSTFVYNALDLDVVEEWVKRQKISMEHLKNPWSVLLIDDCTDDPRVFNCPLFNAIYKNGRHWNMFFILSLQYCMDMKPSQRNLVDGVFILRETSIKTRKKLWENYAGVIPTFTEFCAIMDEITNDYTALYISNQSQSNNYEDCVFYYKAKPVPEGWKFGCETYWDFHHQRYNKNYSPPLL